MTDKPSIEVERPARVFAYSDCTGIAKMRYNVSLQRKVLCVPATTPENVSRKGLYCE